MKPVDALAEAENDHGGATVKSVSGGHEVLARLERVADIGVGRFRLAFVNGEDGTDRDETIDVGGTVQRIEANDVFA